MADSMDPDALALLFVQQFLSEKGYTTALSALEQASGVNYDDDKPRRGSELLELVYTHVEQQLAAGATDDFLAPCTHHAIHTASSRSSRQAQLQQQHAKLQEELMLRSAAADYPSHVGHTIGPLVANLLAVLMWPHEDLLAVGAADGSVSLLQYGSAAQPGGSSGGSSEVWATRLAGAGGVLTLAWHPDIQMGKCKYEEANNNPNSLLLAGCMDGSVHLLHASTGQLLASAKPHSKYVVAAAWAPVLLHPAQQQQHVADQQHEAPQQQQQQRQQHGEQLIATASYDSSCCLLRLVSSSPSSSSSSSQSSADTQKQEQHGSLSLQVVQQVPFSGYVQDVCFLPQGSAPPPPTYPGLSTHSNGNSKATNCDHGGQSSSAVAADGDSSAPTGAVGQGKGQQSSINLVVAVRGTNCLNILTVDLLHYTTSATDSTTSSSSGGPAVAATAAGVAAPTSGSSSGGSGSDSNGSNAVWRVTAAGLVNMSEAGDSHVSFSAMRLAVSPCNRYLLIASDSPILLVLRLADWGVVRRLYGLDTDKFHNASVAWHRSSSYILAGAAHAAVYVYHLGTAKIVAKLRGHTVNVRSIQYDAASNRLATCSFDKSVKVYEQP